jgi:ribosomal protein S6--L-glutamate ligase
LELVTHVATSLGIDHAGFDVAVVHGHCYLLEFNVLFGLDGLHRQGIRLGDMVMRYLGNEGNEPTHPVRPRPIAA